MTLVLKNPHSVLAAIAHRAYDVLEIRLPAGGGSDAWAEAAAAAQRHGIAVRHLLPGKAATKDQGGRAGAEALVKPRQPIDLELLFADGGSGVWLALDCLQDPQNVGAIFRSAAFFGVKGVVLTRDRSAPLTQTAYDVASGGLDVVPFAQPANLSRALELARTNGLWILGASEHAEKSYASIPRDRGWLLVVGNEEKGLRRLTLDQCDDVCAIPRAGEIGSLNVSVATGILLAHLAQPK